MSLEVIQKQKLSELANAVDQLKAAEEIYEEKKTEAKDAKEDYEACRDQVTAISKDLRDIERGTYQPELPFEGPGRESSATLTIHSSDGAKLSGVADLISHAKKKLRAGE